LTFIFCCCREWGNFMQISRSHRYDLNKLYFFFALTLCYWTSSSSRDFSLFIFYSFVCFIQNVRLIYLKLSHREWVSEMNATGSIAHWLLFKNSSWYCCVAVCDVVRIGCKMWAVLAWWDKCKWSWNLPDHFSRRHVWGRKKLHFDYDRL
jgi:hypothetical protein